MELTFEFFITLLLVVSTLTSLFTEAVKKILGDKKYSTNLIVGIIAILTAILVAIIYCVFSKIVITAQVIMYFVLLAIFGWLCAMIGYDKVIQTLKQLIIK